MKTLFCFLVASIMCIFSNSFAQNLEIMKEEISDSGKTPSNFVMKIEYPQIKKYDNENIREIINKEIKSKILKKVEEFSKDLAEWEIADFNKDFVSGMYCEYNTSNTKNIFSIIFYIDHYFSGSAHPNHNSLTMNFDLSNGKLINFENIFDNKNDYLKIFSDYCINYFKNSKDGEYYTDEWLQEGAGPKIENFKSFNIKPDGLFITFDPYCINSYAAGYQTILVNYENIKDLVDKNGILKEFYK
jgi:hypothetical protein